MHESILLRTYVSICITNSLFIPSTGVLVTTSLAAIGVTTDLCGDIPKYNSLILPLGDSGVADVGSECRVTLSAALDVSQIQAGGAELETTPTESTYTDVHQKKV